jgi:hypothetical protein
VIGPTSALCSRRCSRIGTRERHIRRDVALARDRNSFSVKDLPTATGGSVVDVLRNVPAIEVDGDNKVSLCGGELA